MAIANRDSLENCLLVPRDIIGFEEVSGVVEKVDLDTRINPVMLTHGQNPDFLGLKSGERSGLFSVNGDTYKIKGCDIILAQIGAHSLTEPEGGQTLQSAKREVEFIQATNEILTEEGFSVAYQPSAIIHYQKLFKPNLSDFHYPRHWQFIEPFLGKRKLAASVMKIKGDTRLPEIYIQEFKDKGAASAIAYRLGLMAGAQRRVTENKILWTLGNSHVGNYVVFEEEAKVHLGMVDFDAALRYNTIINQFLRLKVKGIESILASMNSPNYNIVGGKVRNENEIAPEYFKRDFIRGFRDGYQNPDKRETIRRADLHIAFGI